MKPQKLTRAIYEEMKKRITVLPYEEMKKRYKENDLGVVSPDAIFYTIDCTNWDLFDGAPAPGFICALPTQNMWNVCQRFYQFIKTCD